LTSSKWLVGKAFRCRLRPGTGKKTKPPRVATGVNEDRSFLPQMTQMDADREGSIIREYSEDSEKTDQS
jgi:hypothetical protein